MNSSRKIGLGWWIGLVCPLLWMHTLSALPDYVGQSGADIVGKSELSEFVLAPVRVVWKSPEGVENEDAILRNRSGQAVLANVKPMKLAAAPGQPAGILIDFGIEIQGSIEIVTAAMPEQSRLRKVRIRFGESVAEAMAETGTSQNAGNDHAVRDQVVSLPWLGRIAIGESGFRFVRIDNVDPEWPALITEIRAILRIRDVPWLGSFRCSDERLNRIWQTGAYTVHLNMQDYLWDGIKRDRLVWMGDLHPELKTIQAVFGTNPVVPASLDLIRDITPVNRWMNNISGYSMWWVILQEDSYWNSGDLGYLEQQKDYLKGLLERLCGYVDASGKEAVDGLRFVDWPTFGNETAVHEGLQALLLRTLDAGNRLMERLGEPACAGLCAETALRMRGYVPQSSGRKAPAALGYLAGVGREKEEVLSILLRDGPVDLSTFYGYYVLEALAKAGRHDVAMDFIRRYWGGMLDMGATTFWEDFDLAWIEGSAPIDELVPEGKKDIHGDFGAHCYQGFRHSLCHGWASGPTAWLSRHILGVEILEPGCTKIRIAPVLDGLEWVEGSYPTPRGVLRLRHDRQADGSIQTRILEQPDGVEILLQSPP